MTRQDVRDAYRMARLSEEEKAELLEDIRENADSRGISQSTSGVSKRWIPAIILAGVICVGLVAACLVLSQREQPEAPALPETGASEMETVPETVPETTPLPQGYLEQLQFVSQGIARGAEPLYYADLNLSTLYSTTAGSIGYTLMDLDGNGVEELILSDGTTLYDVFTLEEERAVSVLSGSERNRYTLTAEGSIFNAASDSAFESYYNLYTLSGRFLVQTETLVFREGSWLMGFGETPITETEAQSFLDSYPAVSLSLTPLPQ